MFGPVRAIEKVADNLYVIPGAGGNSAVFVRTDGVLLVDTKTPNHGQDLINEIKKVTDKPITHIINTHMHADHTGSNSFFPATVEIIAQEKAKAGMEKSPLFQSDAAKVGLPDRTFKDHMTLFSGKEKVELYYFGRGHTNNDILVVFRAARVMHAGDLFPTKAAPLIDGPGGGSALDYAATMAKAVRTIKGVDKVITGHGELLKQPNVQTWQDFVNFAEFNRLYVAHARASLAAGKTAEQALNDFKLPEKLSDFVVSPPLPPAFSPPPGRNFALIYQELGR
jgi:glyoxylase-like metal-dependent hydrolase (beta-lactamase superfamily II)